MKLPNHELVSFEHNQSIISEKLIACKSDTAGLLKTWFSVKKFTEKSWLFYHFNGSKIRSIHTKSAKATADIKPLKIKNAPNQADSDFSVKFFTENHVFSSPAVSDLQAMKLLTLEHLYLVSKLRILLFLGLIWCPCTWPGWGLPVETLFRRCCPDVPLHPLRV